MQTFGIASIQYWENGLGQHGEWSDKSKDNIQIHLNSSACGEERKIETSQEEITIILNG